MTKLIFYCYFYVDGFQGFKGHLFSFMFHDRFVLVSLKATTRSNSLLISKNSEDDAYNYFKRTNKLEVSADEQLQKLADNFDNWKRDLEQLDDVLLFGYKVI